MFAFGVPRPREGALPDAPLLGILRGGAAGSSVRRGGGGAGRHPLGAGALARAPGICHPLGPARQDREGTGARLGLVPLGSTLRCSAGRRSKGRAAWMEAGGAPR